jgi:hypothetical protein
VPGEGAVAGLTDALGDGGWHSAIELCVMLGLAPTDANRRRIRLVADASAGRIAGGQRGYKLVASMDREEFDRARNFLLSQAREMQRRVLEMDKVFYRRQPAPRPA